MERTCILLGVVLEQIHTYTHAGLPGGSAGKESTRNVGDLGSIPGLGRSPGEGKGSPLQYSCLENSMDCTPQGSSAYGDSSGKNTGAMPFPSPGNLPNPGIEPRSPTLQVDSLLSEPPGKLPGKSHQRRQADRYTHTHIYDGLLQ